MNPPTPFPASARSRSKRQNEIRENAFREITSRTNVMSKSALDPLTDIKKTEAEQMTKGASKTPIAPRRFSIASRFAGPKADNGPMVSNPVQSKPKVNKRASLQGAISDALVRNPSVQSATTCSRITTAPSSRLPSKATSISSVPGNNTGIYHRRQSLASGHFTKPHKVFADVVKRPAPGCEKTDSTQSSMNKEKGMILKSASYWVEQVKLAEMLENYGVSIGFFRLAVECGAEPIELLREELIAFIERYSLWSDTFQQLLLCYGVTSKDQEALLSRITASGLKQPPLSSVGVMQSAHGNTPVETGRVGQVCLMQAKSLDQDFSNAMEKHSPEATAREEVQVPNLNLVLHATGRIEDVDLESIRAMDAESITREVVSCILSSMNDNDGKEDSCVSLETEQPVTSYQHNNHVIATSVVVAPDGFNMESISEPNSAHLDEATSFESLPSLDVWNTMSKDSEACEAATQEVLTLTIENVASDSISKSRTSGEEMSVPMELVDTLSDEPESITPSQSPSKERKLNSAQPRVEADGNLLKSLNATTNADDTTFSGKPCSNIPKKLQNKSSGKVSGGRGSITGSSTKNAFSKGKAESPAVQAISGPKFQRERRTSQGLNGSQQKQKSTPVPETRAENPALGADNAAVMATLPSKRPSMSTPKLSTSHRPILTAASKSQFLQPTECSVEDQQKQSANAGQDLDNLVATPQHDSKPKVGEGLKQDSAVDVNDKTQTPVDNSLLATPGSAGLRRSARLNKKSGVSTPGSVSTSQLQKCLGTPT